MALGLGEAGEQNAPLGRAVIGGLLVATFVTLLLVPAVYASLRRNRSFVEVAIKILVPSLVQIPAEAVITRGTQPFVAVVDGESRLRLRPLHLADDDGETARVLDGLRAGKIVALHVGDSVEDGTRVQAVERSGASASAAKAIVNRTAANEQRAPSK